MRGRYIDTADQAKLVRRMLRVRFPGVKFSVRTDRYSMGSAVRVQWTGGPTQKEVGAFLHPYDGQRFDGMIDLRYYADSWLFPDGSATFAGTSGHSYDQDDRVPDPGNGAELVHFAGCITTSRWEED